MLVTESPVRGSPDRPAPLVSIGLPVYNGEAYLRQSLDALLGQTLTDLELVISDNASTDATASIVQEYAARDHRIRYVRQPVNIGAASNHNAVVSLARGRYFKWASHDDLYHPDLVRLCVEALEQHPEAALAHSWHGYIDSQGVLLSADPYPLDTANPSPRARLRSILRTPGGTDFYGVVPTEVMRAVPRHDNYYNADRTFVAGLALAGPFLQVPRVLYYCRQHADQASHGNRRAKAAALGPRRANRSGSPDGAHVRRVRARIHPGGVDDPPVGTRAVGMHLGGGHLGVQRCDDPVAAPLDEIHHEPSPNTQVASSMPPRTSVNQWAACTRRHHAMSRSTRTTQVQAHQAGRTEITSRQPPRTANRTAVCPDGKLPPTVAIWPLGSGRPTRILLVTTSAPVDSATPVAITSGRHDRRTRATTDGDHGERRRDTRGFEPLDDSVGAELRRTPDVVRPQPLTHGPVDGVDQVGQHEHGQHDVEAPRDRGDRQGDGAWAPDLVGRSMRPLVTMRRRAHGALLGTPRGSVEP